MKNYMIAPNHDVDSLVSHVVGEIWQPGIEHRFLEYNMENINIPFESIPISNQQRIIMADLGYSNSQSNKELVKLLSQLRATGTEVLFYDQHDWPEQIKSQAFDQYFHNDKIPSAELMARDLTPKNQVAIYLSEIATKDDYNNPDKDTKDLCDLVNSDYLKIQLINDLAELKQPKLDLSKDAKNSIDRYRIDRAKAFISLEKSYKTHQTKLGQFVTGLAPNILYMKPGHRKIRDDNPDSNVICFYEDIRNCTFKTQTQDQTNILLSLFRGSGRVTEGGFDPGFVITNNNYESARDFIIKTINTFT